MPITLAIRRELIEGFIPLNLHVAWRLLRQGKPFEEILNVRVDIYRFTSLYDGKVIPDHPPPGWRNERWDGILTELRAIFDRRASEPTSDAIEQEGYEVLRPVLESAFDRDVRKWPRSEDRPYGFFTYNLTEGKEPPARRIGLHLANPFAPQSPFSDMRSRADELRRLVEDMGRTHPDVEYIATGSWLNSFQPFLDLFPPEWAASATPFTRLVVGMGWWGQFFDRRGGFHRKNAECLRETGNFPYPVMDCHCRMDVLKTHLRNRFQVG